MASEWLFPTTDNEEHSDNSKRQEELFVFGYACKLFRDDNQATMVDSGKYMIPWMGDERLKIDRYDGRGHLYDLAPYDADKMKGQPVAELSEDEKQIEQLCEEERYLELHTNITEKAMYEEEEWKRYYESLSEGYKAVGFSYDYNGDQQYNDGSDPQAAEADPDDKEYVPASELQVPAGCVMPSTIRENKIIEKTAKFIAEHGVQMEIMMKAKQAHNPQFAFMHFEHSLHPYYRHMVKMIKTKRYTPVIEQTEEDKDDHNDSGEADTEGHHGYLHPALLAPNRASPTPEVYKPVQITMPKVSIHETSYGQLLQSMTKVNKDVAEKRRVKEEIRVKEERDASEYESQNGGVPPPPGIEPVTLPKQEPDTDTTTRDTSSKALTSTTASPPPQIVPPPPDAQPVIDRMAMYVAKNGVEFEIVVKSKNDPRFQFLESWHTHFSYYDFKKHLFIEEMNREKKELELDNRRKEAEKAERLAKGVKFKLKKSKEQDVSSLEKKKALEFDESSDEDMEGDGEGKKEKRSKQDRSRTSTPVRDAEGGGEPRQDESLLKKLAEQRVKDRLSASAREKLSQVDKEAHIKMERKKKAAMFINLLKSKTNTDTEDIDTKPEVKLPSASDSGTSTPIDSKSDGLGTSRNKSKHKTRDRSRDRRSRSRDRRSRSRSSSRSKKKKRRRSPTPPSAYAVVRRSPMRRPPPPPPPRYIDMRGRFSRSPSSNLSSRHRSRSRSASRSKAKKKKRSRSPKTKHNESSHKKSSKKKKKRSRSRDRKASSEQSQPTIPEETNSTEPSATPEMLKSRLAELPPPPPPPLRPPPVVPPIDVRVRSPAGVESAGEGEMEEGETRDSSPEMQDTITDQEELVETDSMQLSEPPDQQDVDHDVTMSSPAVSSPTHRSLRSGSSSRGSSPFSCHSRSPSNSLSPRNKSGSLSLDKSRSLSPAKSRSRSPTKSRSRSPDKSRSRSRDLSRSKSMSKSRSPSRSQSRSFPPSPTGSVSSSVKSKCKSRSTSPTNDIIEESGHLSDTPVAIIDDNSPSRSKSPEKVKVISKSSKSRKRSITRSRSRSPKRRHKSKSKKRKKRSRSRSPSRKSRRSKSPFKKKKSRPESKSRSPTGVTEDGSIMSVVTSRESSTTRDLSDVDGNMPTRSVSSYMLDRVRALIRASKEAVKDDDDSVIGT